MGEIPAVGYWQPGQRVLRIDTQETGTILDVDGKIKVIWDSGRTSYYYRSQSGQLQLQG